MAVMLANITIFLRRKKELRNDALTFAGAMKIIFSALDYWADHFEDDYNIITREMEREAEAEYCLAVTYCLKLDNCTLLPMKKMCDCR